MVSKIVGSAQKVTVVPVSSVASPLASGPGLAQRVVCVQTVAVALDLDVDPAWTAR